MKITSTWLPMPEGERLTPADCRAMGMPPTHAGTRPVYMAFKTRVGDKTVFTGSVIGGLDEAGEFRVSAIGQKVAYLVAAAAPNGRMRIIECKDVATARQRALAGLKAAQDGDGLLIACKDSAVIDAVLITKTFGVQPR